LAIVIRGKTACSICGRTLLDGDDVVLFPHFIPDDAHPLWRFSDSAMHRVCFQDWGSAADFRAEFNREWPKLVPAHPRRMLPDGSIVEA